MPRLIAIDDDPQVLRDLQRELRDPSLQLTTESDPDAALARLLDAGRALPADAAAAADDLSIRRCLGDDDLRKLATA